MPWCPVCRVEYQQGFKTCLDCGAELVDELAPPPGSRGEQIVYSGETHLTATTDGAEAEIIASILAAHGIPVLKRFRQAGGFLNIYMGASTFGVDIFVPSDLLATAGDILAACRETGEDARRSADDTDFAARYQARRKLRAGILLAIILLLGDFSRLF